MVLLLGSSAQRENEEIFEILEDYKTECKTAAVFTVISSRDIPKSDKKRGVVIITDSDITLCGDKLPSGFIGICDVQNTNAVKIFENSRIPVITCGMGNKNTVTATSITDDGILIATQREFPDINGNTVEPYEYKMKTSGIYLPFSVMASFCVLKIYGII